MFYLKCPKWATLKSPFVELHRSLLHTSNIQRGGSRILCFRFPPKCESSHFRQNLEEAGVRAKVQYPISYLPTLGAPMINNKRHKYIGGGNAWRCRWFGEEAVEVWDPDTLWIMYKTPSPSSTALHYSAQIHLELKIVGAWCTDVVQHSVELCVIPPVLLIDSSQLPTAPGGGE